MKRLTIISLFLLVNLLLSGQDIVVTTEVPSVVSVGEQFRVTWTVNSKGGNLEAPEFNDFYLLMGPQTSYSQSTSIVNGKVSQQIKNSFTYYLQATKEGKFTIQPAIYTEKKNEYKSREITIEVVGTDDEKRTESVAGTGQDQNSNSAQTNNVSGSDLYVRLLVSRNKVTMGEYIVATLKIYSRVNLSGIQELNYPDFNGFLKTDLETVPLRTLEPENVNGTIYNTGVLQRFLIYPQKSGTLRIEPSTLTVLLQERARSNDPFFGDFFSSFSTVPKVIATMPVDIEVKPLPSGKPGSFQGTVGSISLSADINADTISVNEALTLKVKISGNGNLQLSMPPEFILSPDIEIYDPKIESNLNYTSSGTEGSRTFEYVLIPRHHGLFEIPPIEYSYYDPDAGRYKVLSTKVKSFYVRKGNDADAETQVFGSVNKESITYLGRDIRYIHSNNKSLKKQNMVLVSRSSFIIMYLSALLLFIIIIIWRREHLKRNSDLAKVRNRKAAKVASARLKTAGKFLKEDNDEEFFSELLKAMWGYLSDKLSIPYSHLNIQAATGILAKKGIDSMSINKIINIIESCEYSRFSPTGSVQDRKDIYRSAEEVIKAIENEI